MLSKLEPRILSELALPRSFIVLAEDPADAIECAKKTVHYADTYRATPLDAIANRWLVECELK